MKKKHTCKNEEEKSKAVISTIIFVTSIINLVIAIIGMLDKIMN